MAEDRGPQRVGMPTTGWTAALVTLVLALAACAPPPAAQPPQNQAQSQASSRIQRTLVVGTGRAVDQLTPLMGTPDVEAHDLVTAGMTNRDQTTFQEFGWLAGELPSLDRGSLKINTDGTMASTWRMRQGIKWHDGTPFDTKDWVLGWQINVDPALPIRERGIPLLIDRIETPDARTVTFYWKQVHAGGVVMTRGWLEPLPRHILEVQYQAKDYGAIENHPYWTTGFVGNGPYKVQDFQPGDVLELQANDDYFLGRPKIDRISWRVINDRNVMLTNLLTGAIDMTMRDALNWDGVLAARDQWEAQGQGRVLLAPVQEDAATPSLNPWLADVRVRQALLHAIDREEIKQALSGGLIDTAHILLAPQHPAFEGALGAAQKYGFDVQRAQTLLQQAGWTRGTDGVLVNQRGEHFSMEFQAPTGTDRELLQSPIANYWKAVGVETTFSNMPLRTLDTTEEYRNRWSGMRMYNGFIEPDNYSNRYASRNIPTEDDRWLGQNFSRWANPEKDRVLDELFAAKVREPLKYNDQVVEFNRLFSVDLPILPIRYVVEPTATRKGLAGPGPKYGDPGENSRSWNAHLWEWTE